VEDRKGDVADDGIFGRTFAGSGRKPIFRAANGRKGGGASDRPARIHGDDIMLSLIV